MQCVPLSESAAAVHRRWESRWGARSSQGGMCRQTCRHRHCTVYCYLSYLGRNSVACPHHTCARAHTLTPSFSRRVTLTKRDTSGAARLSRQSGSSGPKPSFSSTLIQSLTPAPGNGDAHLRGGSAQRGHHSPPRLGCPRVDTVPAPKGMAGPMECVCQAVSLRGVTVRGVSDPSHPSIGRCPSPSVVGLFTPPVPATAGHPSCGARVGPPPEV
jgi:hypothetical protein